ncbi:zinc-ribbon domain-containing protein [Agromyces sp. NPDC056523]|uniref:zinc-ribbon domain-containing protein n=1 Tax=Agromyces sp. NPDC056523 TaxID=3345850 RepID=UPI00366C34C4
MNCRICGAQLPDGAMFCGECGSSTSATPESRRPVDPRPGDTYVLHRSESGVISVPLQDLAPVERAEASAVTEAPALTEAPTRPDHREDDPSLEPSSVAGGASAFVLTFTTGEVVTVSGDGLIGRRPMPQPGEAFAHLVQIVDRGLSVSKTHLEFGEHEGGLWVADRFSSNGTVVRRPGEDGLRCEPGRRVLVPRGSRVEIGEQAFTVA